MGFDYYKILQEATEKKNFFNQKIPKKKELIHDLDGPAKAPPTTHQTFLKRKHSKAKRQKKSNFSS